MRCVPLGGAVQVRIDNHAIVEIAFHGEGICAENKDKVFEPFWRK